MPTYLEHRYRPRGSARAIFADRSPSILVGGPAGTGKSRGCMEKLHAVMKKYAGARALITRKTLASLGSTALVTWRQHVITQDLVSGEVYYYGGSQEEPPQYRYANGSAVMIGGMDKPSKIMSSEYDFAYVQESTELSVEDWEAIDSRMRNGRMPYQQILADANPAEPTHWLKQRADRGYTKLYASTHEENPRLFDEMPEAGGAVRYVVTPAGRAYIARLDRLTGVRYLRLRQGLWVAAEGVIYEEWNSARNLIDQYPIPDDWPRIWSVDFGYTNPFVLQCWAEDPDGNLILYREIYHTRRLVQEHCETIMKYCSEPIEGYRHPPGRPQRAYEGRRWTEPKPQYIVCDHDAEGRQTLSAELDLVTKPAQKIAKRRVKGAGNVGKYGIEHVQLKMRMQDNGVPGLMIMRDCRVEPDQELLDALKPTCTAEEIPAYVWTPPNAQGVVTKDEPLKINDHGCDAMRYLVVDRDRGSRPGIRVTG